MAGDAATPSSAHRLLALVRHAKAESGEDREDHDRQLTRPGREVAAEAGRWLAEHLPQPDLVWCSSAVRAEETWAAAGASLDPRDVVTEWGLYLASADDVVDRVGRANVRSMVVVGHNPTMEQVLAAITGQRRGLRPGAVAVIDLDEQRLVELWQPSR